MTKEKKLNERTLMFPLITIPVLVLFFCFNTLPLLRGFAHSLANFRGYGSYDMVGLRNYIDLFQDVWAGESYVFTLKFVLVSALIVNVFSPVLVLGLNSNIKGRSALCGLYFIPNILSGLVVDYILSYLFTYILPTAGSAAGTGFLSKSLLSSTRTTWFAIMLVCAWQSIAMDTIIYIPGLQIVPEDVYEVEAIDGAMGWNKFRSLTFPLIIPFFTINMVLYMKNFLMVFDQIMALTKGGPAQSTEPIFYLIYNNGMSGGQSGFQSANTVIFFIVIAAIAVIQICVLGKREEQL